LDEYQSADDSGVGTLGFNVVKAERLLADRDLLQVELVNFRLTSYTFRSFDLYALPSNNLTPVFSCATTDSATIGASRFGRSTERSIELLTEKLPAQIRVSMRTQWNPGVESEDPDYQELSKKELSNPPDGLPANESRTEVYSYDGVRFITEHPACDGR
jgi:hypothetical protein